MSTDNLPARQAGSLTTPVEDPWAELRDEFDDGSKTFKEVFGLTMPRLRSDFGRNGRGWVDDLANEELRELRSIVILAYPPSRAWWEKSIDEGGGGAPDCRSHDMVIPDPSSPMRQSDFCDTCRWSKWGADNEKPACAESVNVIAFDTVQARYVWLRFSGTGLKPFKDYISYLTSRRLPSFAVTTNVTLEKQTRDKLEWLTPVFRLGEQLTPDVVRPLREVAKTAMDAWTQAADAMTASETTTTYAPGEEPFGDEGTF